MAKKKKLLKAAKPSDADKAIKAKRTGYRFKTEGNKKLHKQDGDLNAKGKSLYFKKPSKKEVEDFKKNPDGSYPDKTKQIYHETRADRTHSDDNLVKKYSGGGKVKQNAPQSDSYSTKNDKDEKSKPVGKRYTDRLAKKLGKSPNATPTNKDVDKYLGKGVYDEKRKDKSDVSLTKKLEEGGVATVEISCEELKSLLGREPKYPTDFANGKKYEKCFLRPFYRCLG